MDRRRMVVMLAAALATAGCKDMGLEGNIPAAEAAAAPAQPLVAEVHAPVEEGVRLVMDGKLWVPYGRLETRVEGSLRSVGSAAGHTVFARRWEEPPYRTLFTRMPDGRWQAYAPARREGVPRR